MRAIYVNLDRSTDRREWMEGQARQLGISLERFSAVDGAGLKGVLDSPVSAGAMGCFLSHRAVWAAIAEGKDQHVLVLEDDGHLSPDIPGFLSDPAWIPPDADLIHLERTLRYCEVTGRSKRARDRRLWRVVGETHGTGCYIISKDCAARLGRDFKTIDREFDQVLFNGGRPDLTIYKLLPALCMQDKLFGSSQFSLLIDRPLPKVEPVAGFPKLRREFRRVKKQIMGALHLSKTRRRRVEFL